MSLEYIINSIFASGSINPIKILILFISMTILSVFLDEIGFFSYLANATLRKAGKSQKNLFFLLYTIVSILTIFTSNDIIVLTFTPFICYFSSNAKINPIPYLVTVFVAANTWSMALIIGNPTNIYIATYGNIDFVEYLKIMILPTLTASITSLCLLYIVFKKEFSVNIENRILSKGYIKNIPLLCVGLFHLIACTCLLVISSYIKFEMWLIALLGVLSLFVINIIIAIIQKRKPVELISCLKRAPWTLIPFLLIMFILILFIQNLGIPEKISLFMGNKLLVLKYGIASFLACNIMNNIPMSILFSSIINPNKNEELFSVIIGSNLGALLTPIGALAGIMWTKILAQQKIHYGYLQFLKYGSIISIPTLLIALLTLGLCK